VLVLIFEVIGMGGLSAVCGSHARNRPELFGRDQRCEQRLWSRRRLNDGIVNGWRRPKDFIASIHVDQKDFEDITGWVGTSRHTGAHLAGFAQVLVPQLAAVRVGFEIDGNGGEINSVGVLALLIIVGLGAHDSKRNERQLRQIQALLLTKLLALTESCSNVSDGQHQRFRRFQTSNSETVLKKHSGCTVAKPNRLSILLKDK